MAMGAMSSGRPSRRGRGARRTPMAEINVTPLVDVMLVLLIIFMVTAPLMTAGVPVDLPDSRAEALEQERDQITVSIDASGYIYIDDEAVPVGAFGERLATVAPSAGEKPLVTLRADRSLEYARVMAVMGELNNAGFNSISLVTNSSDTSP
ncbi:biopolymer transporter ExbD [Altericroceibacterium spongiae]|uniref:Biopolymer transporter ExbD n=1 Tax=Altericroceibacterium spongiae TaxID=2320269 RepID=A0A420EM09_9SPHN|nr:biopolymer transporter ExbD [Altericroceibacterium spongiae]RKF21680.1 biopolymer transporter ExbD [Altericroceibacterium spongiae]